MSKFCNICEIRQIHITNEVPYLGFQGQGTLSGGSLCSVGWGEPCANCTRGVQSRQTRRLSWVLDPTTVGQMICRPVYRCLIFGQPTPGKALSGGGGALERPPYRDQDVYCLRFRRTCVVFVYMCTFFYLLARVIKVITHDRHRVCLSL